MNNACVRTKKPRSASNLTGGLALLSIPKGSRCRSGFRPGVSTKLGVEVSHPETFFADKPRRRFGMRRSNGGLVLKSCTLRIIAVS